MSNKTVDKFGGFTRFTVTPSVRITKNQAQLYNFVLTSHKNNHTITLPEVIREYSKYGVRNKFSDGTPAYYAYDWEKHSQYLAPLKGDELKKYALTWFVHNLGVFIIKGLLTVMPAMELSQLVLEDEANQ